MKLDAIVKGHVIKDFHMNEKGNYVVIVETDDSKTKTFPNITRTHLKTLLTERDQQDLLDKLEKVEKEHKEATPKHLSFIDAIEQGYKVENCRLHEKTNHFTVKLSNGMHEKSYTNITQELLGKALGKDTQESQQSRSRSVSPNKSRPGKKTLQDCIDHGGKITQLKSKQQLFDVKIETPDGVVHNFNDIMHDALQGVPGFEMAVSKEE